MVREQLFFHREQRESNGAETKPHRVYRSVFFDWNRAARDCLASVHHRGLQVLQAAALQRSLLVLLHKERTVFGDLSALRPAT